MHLQGSLEYAGQLEVLMHLLLPSISLSGAGISIGGASPGQGSLLGCKLQRCRLCASSYCTGAHHMYCSMHLCTDVRVGTAQVDSTYLHLLTDLQNSCKCMQYGRLI